MDKCLYFKQGLPGNPKGGMCLKKDGCPEVSVTHNSECPFAEAENWSSCPCFKAISGNEFVLATDATSADNKFLRQADAVFVKLTIINQLLQKKKRPTLLLTGLKNLKKEIGKLKKTKTVDKKAKKVLMKISLDYLNNTAKQITLLISTRKELVKSSENMRRDFASFYNDL